MERSVISVVGSLMLVVAGAQAATYDLSGRVVRPDGQAAAGTVVYHYRLATGQAGTAGLQAEARLGADGAFEMKGFTYDRARRVTDCLLAVHPDFGFVFWRPSSSSPPTEPIELKLSEHVELRGTVVDEDGKPVAGAPVTIYRGRYQPDRETKWTYIGFDRDAPVPALTARTDADGRFTIGCLPKMPHGYVRLGIRHGTFASTNKQVTFEEIGKEAKIVLEPGGSIDGRLAEEGSGAPGAGITVRAYARVGRTSVSERTQSNQDGRYRLSNLPAGIYRVSLEIPKGAKWTGTRQSGISVAPGETTKAVDFALTSGSLISGKVVDATSGRPVRGVRVYASGSGASLSDTTKSDGAFQLRCPPGNYSVYTSTVPKGYIRPDYQNRRQVSVGKGKDVPSVEIEITKGLTITGRVVDVAGHPLAKARIMPRSSRGSTSSTITDAEGAFTVHGIAPNTSMTILATGASRKQGGSTQVNVGEEPPAELEIRTGPIATVVGRVIDPKGQPIKDVSVRLWLHAERTISSQAQARTGPDGRYQIPAVPGATVSVGTGDYNSGPRSPVLTAEAGKRHEIKDLITRAGPTEIAGRVVDETGRPVPRAMLTLYVSYRNHTDVANSKGEFRFKQLPSDAGQMTIFARGLKKQVAGQMVVQPSAAGEPIVVRVHKAAQVRGRVVDGDGKPLKGANISVMIQTSDRGYSSSWGTGVSDGEGNYRVGGLVPGSTCYIRASAPGHADRSSKRTTLRSGEPLRVEEIVLLKADSFIAGRVTDIEGKPLASIRVSCSGSSGGSGSATTDSKGQYRIENLPRVDDLRVSVHTQEHHYDYRYDTKAGSTNVDFMLMPREPTKPKVPAEEGKPAPEIATAAWLNAPPTTLKDARGKPVLLHFFTIYSRPAAQSMELLKKLHQQHGKGLLVVAIHDRTASLDEVKAFAESGELRFPIALVKSTKEDGWAGETFRSYGVKAVPASFLVDKDGVLRHADVTDGLEQKVAELVGD